jgi:hypothetical protein
VPVNPRLIGILSAAQHLHEALTSLDDVRLELVTTAIRHAAGRRPATWNWPAETGQ